LYLNIKDLPGQSSAMNILLTGGRAPVALELARMLAQSGHRVDLAESFPHHLCRGSRAVARSFHVPAPNQNPNGYISELSDIIKQRNITILIPTCEEVFWIARGLAELRQLCKVISAPLEQLKRLHSKWDFIQQAAAFGFAVPHTQIIHSGEEWNHLCKTVNPLLREGFVLKPVFSRFAENVQLFGPGVSTGERLKRLQPAYAPPASPDRPWIIQQYITGKPICTYSVAYEGNVVAHTAYEARYTANRGSCIYFQQLDHSAALAWVQKFVEKERFTGQIAFDFIESHDNNVLFPLECNPRATSGIHLFSPSDGLVEALLDPESLEQGTCVQPQQYRPSMLALAMLSFGLMKDLSWEGIRHWRDHFAAAHDVIWRLSDPLPFLEQIPLLFHTWRLSKKHRISLSAAMTYDIEWNGEA
jgi:predicted ATP-grasp superfamily ATP-dependent carboligase